MATLTYSDKIIYTGKGYLDAKIQPVNSVNDLNKIPRSQRFIGLTITVLDDGSGRPHDYWLESSLTAWVKKKASLEDLLVKIGEREYNSESISGTTAIDISEAFADYAKAVDVSTTINELKAILQDEIASSKTETIDYVDKLNAIIEGRVKSLEDKSHTHDNYEVLNSITNENVSNWNTAVEELRTFLKTETGFTNAIDSLKEIQKYFEEHGTEVETIVSSITANEEAIATLSDDIIALNAIIGERKDGDDSTIIEKLNSLIINKLDATATVNGVEFEDNAVVIDANDIQLYESIGEYDESMTLQEVLKDVDKRIKEQKIIVDGADAEHEAVIQ